MGVKPVILLLPAFPVDNNQDAEGNVTVAPGGSVSETVEASLCPVSCNGLSRSYSF